MEDTSREYRSMAGKYHTIAVIMAILFVIGCLMVGGIMATMFCDIPLPRWVPFSASDLVIAGGLMALAGLIFGTSLESIARQINRMDTGLLLAHWKYTEQEWELMALPPKGKDGWLTIPDSSIGRDTIFLILLFTVGTLVMLVLLFSGSIPGIRFDPANLVHIPPVTHVIVIGGIVICIGLVWYDRHMGRRSPHEARIAPESLRVGNTLLSFDASALTRHPREERRSMFDPWGAILDRVLLHRGDPCFMEFQLTAFSPEGDLQIYVKVVVPRGQEATAERVLEFFSGHIER